jgi:hypothetical protein
MQASSLQLSVLLFPGAYTSFCECYFRLAHIFFLHDFYSNSFLLVFLMFLAVDLV